MMIDAAARLAQLNSTIRALIECAHLAREMLEVAGKPKDAHKIAVIINMSEQTLAKGEGA